MPSGGADGGTLVAAVAAAGADSDAGAPPVVAKCSQLSLTPRFTQDEKDILYSLFHQHEEVIDIKFRKKQKSKYSVREAWEQIVQEFNSHPGVSAVRNLKQIQKFWLNARLRKQYPFRSHTGQKHSNNNASLKHEQHQQQQQQVVNHAIKDEPEFQLTNTQSPEQQSQGDEYEEMELEPSGVSALDEDPLDDEPQHIQQQQQPQQQQQQQQPAAIQTQQISVDQISAEKLTLNDLLQFKTARPREEIILQIKHPADATASQIAIPSPTRITIPTHHQQPQQHTMATITASGYNQQIISEIKPQQITLAQYQAQQQQQQQQLAAQQQQQQLAVQQQLVVQQQLQQQQQHQVKLQLHSPTPTQQFVSAAAPTFTCTTFNTLANHIAPSSSSVVPAGIATLSNGAAATVAVENYEERINYFKLKEAELRFKEEQVALEKKKIEVNRAQEELKNMRELHRLKVEELKMKIRILQEEEKLLRKSHTT